MSNAQPGHGTLIAVELDPTLTPGVFTTIAEIVGDVSWPEISRPEVEVTPHNDSIDSYVLGVAKRGQLTSKINFIYNNNTHDHLTGLYAMLKDNKKRGWRIRGPLGAAGTDEWIGSGQVQSVKQTSPIMQGARSADFTVRLSGAMIVGGLTYLS